MRTAISFIVRLLITLLCVAIGAIVGFALPLELLIGLSALYSWSGGDPTGAGAFSFMMIPLAPIGIVSGVIYGVSVANRLYTDPFASRHTWRGRAVIVRGRFLASHLWMRIGYTITIDGRETFSTSQAVSTNDFRWAFTHNDRTVEGHFATFGTQGAIPEKYNLTIDGENLGPIEVKLSGSWGFMGIAMAVPIVFALVANAIYRCIVH